MSSRTRSSFWSHLLGTSKHGKSGASSRSRVSHDRAATALQNYRRRACFESLENRQVMAAYLKIESFDTSNVGIFDHTSITGDDHGGIALSTDRVFVTGDNNTGIITTNLSSASGLSTRYEGLFSDLATGKVYTLATSPTTA